MRTSERSGGSIPREAASLQERPAAHANGLGACAEDAPATISCWTKTLVRARGETRGGKSHRTSFQDGREHLEVQEVDGKPRGRRRRMREGGEETRDALRLHEKRVRVGPQVRPRSCPLEFSTLSLVADDCNASRGCEL